jgi:hypothetical protein
MSAIQDVDYSADLLQCLLWQYNDADKLQALVQSKQDWYDTALAGFWSDWVRDVFDLTTANAFGLTVWANILGMPLVVIPAPTGAKPTFGFAPNWQRFNQGNFAAGNNVTTLTQAEGRLILRLRYFQLVTRGAAPEVNAFLAQVFGTGEVYAKTTGPMQATYFFTHALSSSLKLLLTSFDILPRPAGVTVVINSP